MFAFLRKKKRILPPPEPPRGLTPFEMGVIMISLGMIVASFGFGGVFLSSALVTGLGYVFMSAVLVYKFPLVGRIIVKFDRWLDLLISVGAALMAHSIFAGMSSVFAGIMTSAFFAFFGWQYRRKEYKRKLAEYNRSLSNV